MYECFFVFFFFSSRRRHTRCSRDWSSDVCSSDLTHWLGALVSSMRTIGVKDTAVRRVIHRAAELVPTPITCIALVVRGDELHGMWVGDYQEAWIEAADLSAKLEIIEVPHGFLRVLSMPSTIYDDLWTAAKAMYKTEPAIADGGEVVIYAP